ncbi:MAG: arginine--tRNA ligase [Clostridiales bacterium]|jgi:arginyl-tRNA synthetase|nr:arginine--tRNA ligase [Clostridiales bacterium]
MDFKKAVADILTIALGDEDIYESLETPRDVKLGDYAFPCFRLAKTLKKSPAVIAAQIKEKVENKSEFVARIETAGAYVNFFLDKGAAAKAVISEIIDKGERYGRGSAGRGAVTIDFSSPNVAKPFHIGHLRTTVIGNALYNIYDFIGYKSVGINHLGDWGTQFGKMITAYVKWGDREEIEKKGVKELNRLYVLFHREAKEDKSLEDEARAWFIKMQNGDEDALSVWRWFVEISLREFNKIYRLLDIKFDYFTGESFYNDKMDAVVTELKEKGLLEESDGAMIVNLERYDMPPLMVLRKDGGTLYATRDLATAFYRKEEFNFVKSLYVVGLEQSLHFKQLFKVIELMGYDWDMAHIPFGLVRLEGGKLSTREGQVVLMEELLDEAVKRSKAIIERKNPSLDNKDEVARQVGVGAIIFNDLYNSRIKDVVFSWERILSFDGETGPYVQYTHARARAVLANGGTAAIDADNIDFSILADEFSYETVKLLGAFGDKAIEAAEKCEPYIITRYLVDLAQAFNRFYHENMVLSADAAVKTARLALVFCVKTVLASGLKLIGVAAPEKM